jgi:hypothetical protein
MFYENTSGGVACITHSAQVSATCASFSSCQKQCYSIRLERQNVPNQLWGMSIALFCSPSSSSEFPLHELPTSHLIVGWSAQHPCATICAAADIEGGDVILTLNSYPASCFASLAQVTSYVKVQRVLDMIILRWPRANAVAKSILSSRGLATSYGRKNVYVVGTCPSPQTSAEASDGAFHVLEQDGVIATMSQQHDRRFQYSHIQSVHNQEHCNITVVLQAQLARTTQRLEEPPSQCMHHPSMPPNFTRKLFSKDPESRSVYLQQSEGPILSKNYQSITTRCRPHGMAQDAGGTARRELQFDISRQKGCEAVVVHDKLRGRAKNNPDLEYIRQIEEISNPAATKDTLRDFLNPSIGQSFERWLKERKTMWRKNWKVTRLDDLKVCMKRPRSWERDDLWDSDETDVLSEVRFDFWAARGFPDFRHWLVASQSKWKRNFSWNREKAKQLEQECEEVVQFPGAPVCSVGDKEPENHMVQFHKWLHVRKQQWRIENRKRQRKLSLKQGIDESELKSHSMSEDKTSTCAKGGSGLDEPVDCAHEARRKPLDISATIAYSNPYSSSNDVFCIDLLLEKQERRKTMAENRPPFDISFLFKPELGASDDIVGYVLEFLPTAEHGTLLCLTREANEGMKRRSDMWKSLCPSHWDLPRRPRQPWHSIYLNRLKLEYKKTSKLSDDVLEKAVEIMMKSDACHKIETLVKRAEKKFDFQVNYTSGVVLERNSLLNIAAIYQRSKIVKWLLDCKGADIESVDRGRFSPLLNASWTGNKYLVRCLLSHGADRTKVGTFHYTQGIAPMDFKGLTAEGWARNRGHEDVADTIHKGI